MSNQKTFKNKKLSNQKTSAAYQKSSVSTEEEAYREDLQTLAKKLFFMDGDNIEASMVTCNGGNDE